MKMHHILASLIFVMLVALAPCRVANSQSQLVDIEMVLAVDISSSVDDSEYELQMQGLAEAFRHPEVIAAVDSLSSGGIAMAVVQWSGTWAQSIVVDWRQVSDLSLIHI